MSQMRKVKDSTGTYYVKPVTDEYGSATWERYEPGDAEVKQYDRRRKTGRPKGPTTPKVIGDNANANMREIELQQRGEASQIRAREVESGGTYQKLGTKFIREIDKMGAGLSDIMDFGSYVMGGDNSTREILRSTIGAINPAIGELMDLIPEDNSINKGPLERTSARMTEQAEKDELFREMDESGGLTDLASTPMYMASGRVLDPVTKKLVSGPLGDLVQSTKGIVRKGFDKFANSIDDIVGGTPDGIKKDAAQAIQSNITNPTTKTLNRWKKEPTIDTRYNENLGEKIITGTGTSSIESGIHYDENMLDGAMSGLIGSTVGAGYEPLFSKAKNINKDNVNRLLDWAKNEHGFRVLPGMETGQPKMQRLESGMRMNEKLGGYMREVDNANDEVVARTAAKAMGMEDVGAELSPEYLSKHMKQLKGQYEMMEDMSIGKIDKVKVVGMAKEIAQMQKSDQNKVKPFFNELATMKHSMTRNRRGRYNGSSFSGKDYKNLRARIKTAKDTAFGKKDYAQVDAFRDMIAMMDGGMKSGIRDSKGLKTANGDDMGAMWSDLREKWAITDMVMKKGMNKLNEFDSGKMGNHFMAQDPKRMLMEQGGRIRDLQRLAKLHAVQKKQAGRGLDRHDIEGEKGEKQHLMSTPMSLRIPMMARIRAGLYRYGFPSKTGILGMDPKNKTWNTPDVSRAAEQATDSHRELGEAGHDVYKDPVGAFDRSVESIFEYLDRKKKSKGQ
jgi:hypothetical protein